MTNQVIEQLHRDMYLFNNGQNFASYRFLGNRRTIEDGQEGIRFTLWAPNADNVYLVGDFNQWQFAQMQRIGQTGAWSYFCIEAKEGDCYKYVIEDSNGFQKYKIDPYAKKFELPPKDASIVYEPEQRKWQDSLWKARQQRTSIYEKPINIYEVHATSWRKHPDGRYYTFAELEHTLLPYVKEMGYTHIEFMPLMEHPLDASWGYQITGFFALAARYGTLDAFQHFVDVAHQYNIGIIVDWVPGHFCRNDNALAYFDGTPTFEYADQNRANNTGWGTLNFDLGKLQVHSFLISSALFWLKECHVDGLRVDAVSNMLYLDYDGGPWTPNEDGSNHNRQGVAFLQKLNTIIFSMLPQTLMIAEESSAWAGVTRPVHEGGLGFNYKWNMGWMNDTLSFFAYDPVYRKYHFKLITFTFMYSFNENFILPLSHDEVVHGKNSLLGKMPGDRYNQFANLRTLQAYMMTYPGKKLNFMGYELGQFLEWRFYSELEWVDLQQEFNAEYHYFIKELNHLYRSQKALYECEHQWHGLTILDADNASESLLMYIRQSRKQRDFLVVVCNFTPVERQHVLVGVPYAGQYEVLFNTESKRFGGTWENEQAPFQTQAQAYQKQPYTIEMIVPAMSVQVIRPKRIYVKNKNKKETE